MEFLKKILYNKVFTTIRFRLIASFMVPIAFIIILGIVSFQLASNSITNSYENSTRQSLEMTSAYLQYGFDSVLAGANQYSNDDTIKKYFMGFYEDDIVEKSSKQTEITNSIKAKKTTEKFIEDIYLFSDRYQFTSSMTKMESDIYTGFMDTELGTYVQENKMGINWIGSNPFLDEKLGVPSSQYGLRLVRLATGTNMIIVMDVDRNTMEGVMADLDFDQSGILAIVTADGKEMKAPITADKNTDAVVAEAGDIEATEEAVFTNQDFYRSALEGEQKSNSSYITYNHKSYLFIYSKIGDTGAMICGLIPKSTIVGQVNSIKKVSIALVVVSSLIAVGTAILISRGIAQTIKLIIAKLKIAAKGDLTIDFSNKRKDEFHILIDEIQNTFKNMKGLIQQVKVLSGEVSGSSDDVNTTSKRFLKSTEEISYAMNEIEQGINQQARDAEECLSQMDHLSRKIELVSENTKEIGSIANITRQSVQQGTVTTEDLNTQTVETITITTDIINEIQNLEKKSASISKIVNVINDIAIQTNLLSLNASIEAARAGEAGKGFSVVASEIRTLADRSKESVNNIKAIIDGIQKDTMKAVSTARKVESVMRLQEKAVENTTQSYQTINESVENLVIYLKEIFENVDSIKESRVSTLGAIENISAVLEEIAASSNTVSQTAGEQLASVENLNKSAGNLNGNAAELVDAVDKFKV